MKKPIISAPLNVVTGTLGAGKTLFAIQQADLLVKTKQASQIYQVGINDPDTRKLPHLPFPLEDWVKHADAGELKDAVIIVDEFHKWMPQRGPGRPPKWIEELAEARKRGCIFILLTQSVEFDHFLKGTRLNKHYYLSRKGYLARSTVYEWTARFVADPEANKDARKEAVITLWRHPKDYFGWYTSAERHRFKVRLPLRVWAAVVFVPIAVFFAYRGVSTVQNLAAGELPLSSAHAEVMPDQLAMAEPQAAGSVVKPTSDAVEYLEQFEPLLPHLPWSGRVYQGREVVAKPDIFCMASGWDGGDACNCYTEQATKLPQVPAAVCRSIARNGIYNPYRAPLVSAPAVPGVPVDAGVQAEPVEGGEQGLYGVVIPASGTAEHPDQAAAP